MRPDFFIIGAGKSGTSGFRRLLMQHPAIECFNEINFFSNDIEYNKGKDYYLRNFELYQDFLIQ